MLKWLRRKDVTISPTRQGQTCINGPLAQRMSVLKPGEVVRMKVSGGEEFILLYADDFEFILEKAQMRAVDDPQEPDGKAPTPPLSGG